MLSLKGSPSLGELFDRHLPTEQSKGLAQRLAKEGVIRRAGASDWLPSKRTLIVSSDSSSALLRLPCGSGLVRGSEPDTEAMRLLPGETVYV